MKTIDLVKNEAGVYVLPAKEPSKLDRALARLRRGAVVGVGVAMFAAPAFATGGDPTYTSQIGDMLQQVNMTALNTDLAAWGGVAITIFLTIAGIKLVRSLLHVVMGRA